MKLLLSILLLCVCTAVNAQSKTTLEQLQQRYEQNAAWENPGLLTYDTTTKVIAVKNYRIPVSDNTQLRATSKTVEFFMQNGTAVTDVNDADWKRAAFEIPFKDKKSAIAFVNYFNRFKEER